MDPATGRILIVDDEPPLLKMMSAYFSRLGYPVATADSTDRAWALVEAEPKAYAAAILDGSMPGMSMEELARRLLGANPKLCVLAASGYPVDTSVLAASAPGRVGFLHKPFTPETLAATIRGLLAAQEEKL
jgi:two-component system, cell cycle sensor histidine kinase and response regulator CckA